MFQKTATASKPFRKLIGSRSYASKVNFFNRSHELKYLEDYFVSNSAMQAPKITVVLGGPNTGKSRLMNKLFASLISKEKAAVASLDLRLVLLRTFYKSF